MRDIFITGLGIGNEFNVCEAMNINYDELLHNPQVLLWANKIYIPEKTLATNDILSKEYDMVMSILEKEKIVKRFHKNDLSYNYSADSIINQSLREINDLIISDQAVINHGDGKTIPLEITIDKYRYCVPMIASINSSIIAASELNASCLFSDSEALYVKTLFKNHLKSMNISDVLNDVYKELFTVKLPNKSIMHEYGTHRGCSICGKSAFCNDSYLIDVERQLIEYLTMRNMDEMQQLRSEIDAIIVNQDDYLGANSNEILLELSRKERNINRKIYQIFPKVERFSSLITMVLLPFPILGDFMSKSDVTLTASAIGAITLGIKEYISHYKSQHNWVNFIDKNNTKRC